MLSLLVDEAYAFDYLSILSIKSSKGADVSFELDTNMKAIKSQLGDELFLKIITSDEYINLYEANLKTFDAVDGAKSDRVLASYIDDCNYQRTICKRSLQLKHFSSDLNETKIGYEVYDNGRNTNQENDE